MRVARKLRLLSAAVLTLATHGLAEPFDGREATIEGVHNALVTGLSSCREVVSGFLARIEAFNPTVNAIISLNPDALTTADELDRQLAAGNVTGRPLFCIPILLKDNYDAVGMATTGGCLALRDSRPTADAPTVRAFRDAGAVILGKANLHELALEGLSVSSLGGQTFNPYDHTRTPGGSSGGTGAAVACSFAVLGTGTDTVNSLRSPAASNSLFSFRPTRGLISRAGVIPISYTQDAVGAIGRTVRDLAVALTVMAGATTTQGHGYDPADNVTALVPPEVRGRDYTAALSGGSLRGLRMGVVRGFFNDTPSPETTPVNEAMARILSLLRGAGVTLVNVTEAVYNATAISAALDVQTSEYREGLTAYLSNPGLRGTHPTSFADLYYGAGGSGDFLVIPSQYGYVRAAAGGSTGSASYAAAQLGIANLTGAVRATFARLGHDALVYPEQKNLVVRVGSASQSGRNGILAAVTGSPVVVVPAGFSAPDGVRAPLGVPIGMEMLGLPWTEHRLLNMAQHVARLAPVRRMPAFANGSVEARTYGDAVPHLGPDSGNIAPAYPVGRL